MGQYIEQAIHSNFADSAENIIMETRSIMLNQFKKTSYKEIIEVLKY